MNNTLCSICGSRTFKGACRRCGEKVEWSDFDENKVSENRPAALPEMNKCCRFCGTPTPIGDKTCPRCGADSQLSTVEMVQELGGDALRATGILTVIILCIFFTFAGFVLAIAATVGLFVGSVGPWRPPDALFLAGAVFGCLVGFGAIKAMSYLK